MMRPQIIIADDDPVIRTLVELRLSAAGYSVATCADGSAALARLEAATPALLLLDLRMPVMDGLEVLRRLRTLPRRPPVMVLSASADTADVDEARKLGALGYLLKPFDPEVLAARVSRLASPAFEADPEGGPPAGPRAAPDPRILEL